VGALCSNAWHVAFNPEKELIRYRNLWVLMPGCPLAVWNREAFMEIGNSIGKFLYVDPGLLAGSDRRMGKLLVEVDMFDGLSPEIELEWRGVLFVQKLDYQGVPFRCSVCKETGHLRHKCSGFYKKLLKEMNVESKDEEIKAREPELNQSPEIKPGNKHQDDLDSDPDSGKINHLSIKNLTFVLKT
jgi:hypothetical protein